MGFPRKSGSCASFVLIHGVRCILLSAATPRSGCAYGNLVDRSGTGAARRPLAGPASGNAGPNAAPALTGVFQDFLRFEFRAGHTGSVSDVLRLDDQLVVVAAVGRVGAADLVAPWRRGCRRLLRSGVGVAF